MFVRVFLDVRRKRRLHIAEENPMVQLQYQDIKLVYSDTLGLFRTGYLANHPFWPLNCRKEQPAGHGLLGQNCSTIIRPEALEDVSLIARHFGEIQG